MICRLVRLVAIACGLACAVAAPASADFLFTPFVGTTFAPDTNLAPLETGGGSKKVTIGGAAGFLSDGVFGAEVNTSYSFSFFKGDNTASTALGHSSVGTLMGDVLVAVPVSITHESLRPYFVAGAGLMHASVEYISQAALEPLHRNLKGMEIGGGAIGFVNNRAGFRFDVRRFSSLNKEAPIRPLFGGSRLSFWRLSVGVTIRY